MHISHADIPLLQQTQAKTLLHDQTDTFSTRVNFRFKNQSAILYLTYFISEEEPIYVLEFESKRNRIAKCTVCVCPSVE